jgi:hypothetical protein
MKILLSLAAVILAGAGAYSGEGAADNQAGENNMWKIGTHTEKVGDLEVNYFSVDNGTIYADFSDRAAWTLRKLKYKGEIMVRDHHGAWNGTVCSIPDNIPVEGDPRWSGTGHGDEKIESLQLLVDGQPHEYSKDMKLEGAEIRIVKKSRMQALAHTAEIVFPASGDYIMEKHHYKAVEDMAGKFNFMYAFMHCNNKSMAEWLAGLDAENKTEEEGIADKNSLAAPLKDIPVSLEKDIKSLAFYNAEIKKGLVYVYPEVYKGSGKFKNSIYDRTIDVKFYFRPEIDPKSPVGKEFFYQIKVTPFEAEPEEWKNVARELRKNDSFPKSEAIAEK